MLNLTEIPIAASSRKVYLSALAGLDRWLRGREVTDETLSAYLSYLFDKGKSPSHAEGVLKAVRWRALSEDKDDPRGKLCHNAIANFRRQGVGRGRGPVDGLSYKDADKLIDLAIQIWGSSGFRVGKVGKEGVGEGSGTGKGGRDARPWVVREATGD